MKAAVSTPSRPYGLPPSANVKQRNRQNASAQFSSWVSELGVPLPEGAVYQGGGLGEHIVPEGASTTGWDGEHLDAIYLFPNKDNDTVWVEIQQIGKNTGFVVPSSGEKRLINEEYEISYEFTVSGLEVSLNFRESRRGASR